MDQAGSVDQRRRQFLIRCCQGASAALIPTGLGKFAFPFYRFSSDGEPAPLPDFHLHPHYRAPLPLDEVLRKANAEFDDFVTEKYADRIAGILGQWSAGLLLSPQNVAAVEKVLLPSFSGASLKPKESRTARPGSSVLKRWIEVLRNSFSPQLSLGRSTFLAELVVGDEPIREDPDRGIPSDWH